MKRVFILLMCVFLAFSVSGCGKTEDARDILYRICADSELPSGVTYLSGAPEGSSSYLSHDTAEVMYGESAVDEVFPLVKDYAIYLSSFAEPYEVAVFECYSRSDTDEVARMCLERAEVLKVALRGTQYSSIAETAKVEIKGKLVMMVVAGG